VSDETTLRTRLVDAARHLAGRGLSPGGSGNLSVRWGERLLITPTGSSLSRVEPGQLVSVRATGEAIDGSPSKELPLHRAMYAGRPDAAAVVHLHSPFATAASCLPPDADGFCPVPALTPYQVMRFPRIPIAAYARPGSAELAESLTSIAGAYGSLLMSNHGLLVAADGLDRAVDLAEELEAALQLHFILQGTAHRTLSAQQRDALG
jgi:ribulose-5-phosphate 4-epimerase/fuculose-1-phosphate aldolase